MSQLDEAYMALVHGYAWREKVWARWRSMPRWRRVYWTFRGKHPKHALADPRPRSLEDTGGTAQ